MEIGRRLKASPRRPATAKIGHPPAPSRNNSPGKTYEKKFSAPRPPRDGTPRSPDATGKINRNHKKQKNMKTKQLWPFIAATLLVAACAAPEEKLTVTPRKQATKQGNLEISITRGVVSSTDPALVEQCAIFNDRVDKFVDNLQKTLFPAAPPAVAAPAGKKAPADAADEEPETREFIVSDVLFRATNHYISLRLDVYAYTGGAHGDNSFYTFNYDLRQRKFITNDQLLDYARRADIEKLLQAHFNNPDNAFTETPTLDDSALFNFTDKELHVTYPPYILGPFSAGAAEISVPLTELKAAIKLPL
jgi:hypothetical protein